MSLDGVEPGDQLRTASEKPAMVDVSVDALGNRDSQETQLG